MGGESKRMFLGLRVWVAILLDWKSVDVSIPEFDKKLLVYHPDYGYRDAEYKLSNDIPSFIVYNDFKDECESWIPTRWAYYKI